MDSRCTFRGSRACAANTRRFDASRSRRAVSSLALESADRMAATSTRTAEGELELERQVGERGPQLVTRGSTKVCCCSKLCSMRCSMSLSVTARRRTSSSARGTAKRFPRSADEYSAAAVRNRSTGRSAAPASDHAERSPDGQRDEAGDRQEPTEPGELVDGVVERGRQQERPTVAAGDEEADRSPLAGASAPSRHGVRGGRARSDEARVVCSPTPPDRRRRAPGRSARRRLRGGLGGAVR